MKARIVLIIILVLVVFISGCAWQLNSKMTAFNGRIEDDQQTSMFVGRAARD
jgi:outer membrane lipoprotein-sorting protein